VLQAVQAWLAELLAGSHDGEGDAADW